MTSVESREISARYSPINAETVHVIFNVRYSDSHTARSQTGRIFIPQGGSTMFDQIFERSDALRCQLANPLREVRLAYLRHRAEQGAPRSTLRKLAQYLMVVTERLNLQAERTVTTTQIERAADQWARRRLKHHKIKGGFSRKSKSCFICVATNWLHFLGRLQASKTRPNRFAQLVSDFAWYLDKEKAMAPRTIITRCWVAKDFVDRALHLKRALTRSR